MIECQSKIILYHINIKLKNINIMENNFFQNKICKNKKIICYITILATYYKIKAQYNEYIIIKIILTYKILQNI